MTSQNTGTLGLRYPSDFNLATINLVTPKGVVHEFEALDRGCILCCVHAIRDGDTEEDVAPPNITEEQAKMLAKVRYVNTKFNKRYVTFAWDKFKDEKIIMKGIDRCVKAGIPTQNMQFFILIKEPLHSVN